MENKAEKWCESWEKNFDSTLKAINKFKDDLKTKPNLPDITRKRFWFQLQLLTLEIAEIEENFGYKEEINHEWNIYTGRNSLAYTTITAMTAVVRSSAPP